MTEAEWLTRQRVDDLLIGLCRTLNVANSRKGRRKLRLFACARWIFERLGPG